MAFKLRGRIHLWGNYYVYLTYRYPERGEFKYTGFVSRGDINQYIYPHTRQIEFCAFAKSLDDLKQLVKKVNVHQDIQNRYQHDQYRQLGCYI
jgi:hypothetical protein